MGTLSRRAVVSAMGGGAAALAGLHLGSRPPTGADRAAVLQAAMPLVLGSARQYARPQIAPGYRLVMPAGVTVLEPDARSTAAGGQLWPVVSRGGRAVDLAVMPPAGAATQAAVLTGFTGRGWYEIRDQQGGLVDRQVWNATRLPYLRLAQEWGATTAHPYWGAFYTVRLQPISVAA